jgi:hypothetical protein
VDTVFEINSHYLVFAPEYKGVNIWAGEASQNHQKGCDDELKSIVFDVDWPSMQPSQKPWPIARGVNNIEISIHSSGTLQGKERDNVFLLKILLGQATQDKWTEEMIEENKSFDEALQMFSVKNIFVDKSETRNIYWSERGNGSVDITLECHYWTLNPSKSVCTFRKDLPEYDAYLQILFLSVNLKDWQTIESSAVKLVQSFIKN